MPPEDFFDEDWEEPSQTQETAVTRPAGGAQTARPETESGPRPRIPRPSRIPGSGRLGGGRTGGPRRPGGGRGSGQLEYGRLAVLGAGILVLLVVGYLVVKGLFGGSSSNPTETYFSKVKAQLIASDALGARLQQVLNTPGITAPQVQKKLEADVSAAQEQYAAAKSIKPTSQLVPVHPYLLQALQYRVNGLRCLEANVVSAANGASRGKIRLGAQALSRCMQRLMSSDVIYADSYASAAHDVLRSANIVGQVPTSRFLKSPDIKLVTTTGFAPVLLRLRPGAVHGLHGVELVSVKADGKTLTPGTLNTVTFTSGLTFKVTVKNGGHYQEVSVPVMLELKHAGQNPLVQNATIPSIQPNGSATATISNPFAAPNQPQFSQPYTLFVMTGPVPGERNKSNNSGTYRVAFKVAA
ncbi:MAG: hypothetical protein ACTHNU_04135 [Gaiellales bacterium]